MKYGIVLAAYLLLSSLAQAQMYQWKDENGRLHFSDKPPARHQSAGALARVGAVSTGQAHSSTQPSVRPVIPSLGILDDVDPTPILISYRQLLETMQYGELNIRLYKLIGAAKQDPEQEYLLNLILSYFPIANPRHLALIDEWIAHSPREYAPLLVRAQWYRRKAWDIRGEGYMSSVSDAAKSLMTDNLNLAETDLKKVLINGGHIAKAYMMLIENYAMQGRHYEQYRYYQLGTVRVPASFWIHRTQLTLSSRRWGGGLQQMHAVVERAMSKLYLNPKIAYIENQLDVELARDAMTADDYSGALAILEKSSGCEEYTECLYYKARILSKLDRDLEALSFFEMVVSLGHREARYFWSLAYSYRTNGYFSDAFKSANIARLMQPSDQGYQEKTSGFSKSLARHHQAVKTPLAAVSRDYELVERNRQNTALSYRYWSLYFSARGDTQRAQRELENAIANDKDCFECIRVLDLSISRDNQDWPRILELWKPYLENHPDDGEAHKEIAGTYYHHKDFTKMQEHARKAVALGVSDAAIFLETPMGPALRGPGVR
jgi:tetratricopeptide (TPR) repeat protein